MIASHGDCLTLQLAHTAQAEKRAERLSVSALAALSNLLEAVGEDANSALCRPVDVDTASVDGEDAGQSRQVRKVREEDGTRTSMLLGYTVESVHAHQSLTLIHINFDVEPPGVGYDANLGREGSTRTICARRL